MIDAFDSMPEWYKEVMTQIKEGRKEISPEKQIIIDFLKQKIKELESN